MRRTTLFAAAALALLCPLALGVACAQAAWQVSAWTEGDRASLATATKAHALDEVSADWWISNPDGSVDTVGDDAGYNAVARQKGVRLLVTLSNWSDSKNDFDPDVAHAILASPAGVSAHVALLAQLCATYGYDGIDVDWESVYAADRDRFTSFVAQLATALHAEGKIVSIAVAAKTSEPGDWQGAQSEDYAALGAAVDEFKIMTYDYSGGWSPPGPISPTGWMASVLRFAESKVASARIWLGVPFYGYNWRVDRGHKGASSVLYRQAEKLLHHYRAHLCRLPCGEATFAYLTGNHHRVVVFQDRTALTAKLAVLTKKHPHIAGIAIWVMGGEDPRFWPLIAAKLK